MRVHLLKSRIFYLALFIFIVPLTAQAIDKSKPVDTDSTRLDAYDPFADYSEFENTAEEQENIHFFQTGRFLTLGITGGARFFTFNMARIYQLGPAFGVYLNYFFDLNFALQFAVGGSTHGVSLLDPNGAKFIGATDLITIGIDFKYFLDKGLFSKSFSWIQPYFFLGALSAQQYTAATLSNHSGGTEDKGFGVNSGLGLEFNISRKFYCGLEYAFQFVTLEKEALPIQLNVGPGSSKGVNFIPFGDWMNVQLILGVIF